MSGIVYHWQAVLSLPDAILDSDIDGNLRLLHIEKINSSHFQYVTNNSTKYFVQFNSTTGLQIDKFAQSNGDFASIQEYISNGHALYYGGTSNAGIGVTKFTGLEDTPATLSADKILKTNSTGDQIILVDDVEITSIDDIADVQTSGTGHEPVDGNALVWNEAHGHWMPGIASTSISIGAATLEGTSKANNTLNDGFPQGKYSDPIDYILDGDTDSILFTYTVSGATDLVLTMPGLDAGQQVEIHYQRGTEVVSDIEFNGTGIGAIADNIRRWSNPQTAIAGTNTITIKRNTSGGSGTSNTAVGIAAIKVDGEFYDGAAFTKNTATTTFAELTDTPSTLNAGSYLRVNSAGDGVEQIKTAPLDGGIGDNSIIQGKSNFDGKLPDAVLLDNGTVGPRVYALTSISTGGIQYTYWSASTNDNSYFVSFNNDPTGSNFTRGGKATQHSASDSSTLQEFIDNGRAIFNGEKSGTIGLGSLSAIKTKANTSASGGFYTELPDALLSQGNSNYEGVYRLHWINPDTVNANGTIWEVIYRVEDFDGTPGDYYMGFRLDANGTNVAPSGSSAVGISKTQNLRWFIENGRAIYYGGSNESNTVSARIDGSNGTIVSSNYDWIESVTKVLTLVNIPLRVRQGILQAFQLLL